MAAVVLKPGRERSLLRRHPWIFTNALARVEGRPGVGRTVEVRAADGTLLGRGAFSPRSQIAVRMWSWDPAEPIDDVFFRRRLQRAIAARRALLADETVTACRLVHAESDGLPGLVVDRYGDWLVLQITAAGPERWRETLIRELTAELRPAGIHERSDTDARKLEGLPPRTGPAGETVPPEFVEIREGRCRFLVDVARGHKTGFYLDQRDARAALVRYAADAEVLNAFAYTGAFAVAALSGGARHVTNVDTSAPALELAARNVALNGFAADAVEPVEGDVFAVLRQYRDAGRQFDVAVLDPPRFAASRTQVEGAARGYKDVNLQGLKLLRPGGTLFTFSCSGHVDAGLFFKIVAGAALDAGRDVRVVARLGQPADHPVALTFPEGEYLKGLVCRVD